MDNNIKNNEKNYNAFLEKVEQQRLAIIDGTLNINYIR